MVYLMAELFNLENICISISNVDTISETVEIFLSIQDKAYNIRVAISEKITYRCNSEIKLK